jgi:Zn-dependent alcohol dehydrogenase
MAAIETAGKPITCNAAVMWETGKPLVVEEVRACDPLAAVATVSSINCFGSRVPE